MARILVVDDEPEIRQVLGQLLNAAGHEVHEAPDGRQALAMHHTEPFDLLILDMMMPERDGIETIMQLREEESGVRIVAMSGGGRFGVFDPLTAARHLGVQYIILKPFQRQEVLRAVEEALAASS